MRQVLGFKGKSLELLKNNHHYETENKVVVCVIAEDSTIGN